jgi:hypothetical protein
MWWQDVTAMGLKRQDAARETCMLHFKRTALLNTSWPAAESRATHEQTRNKAGDALTKHHHRNTSAENVNEYACTLLAMGKLQRSANSIGVENGLYSKTEGSMGEARKAHVQNPDKWKKLISNISFP